MHYEQQETLLTPSEINGSESVSCGGMEDVNAKSSLTPQIAGPSPVVFSSLQKSLARSVIFPVIKFPRIFPSHLSFSFDGLSHGSKRRLFAGAWARREREPNGLCLEQRQMNNEIQQGDEKKIFTRIFYFP